MSARIWTPRVSLFLGALMHLVGGVGAVSASRAFAAEAPPALAATPGVVRVSAATGGADLARLAPTQVLEFPRGTRLTVAQVQGLDALATRLRGITRRGVLRQPLSGPALPVTSRMERSQLENAPDATVLTLPDGRKMTAGQFKAVLPHLRVPVRKAPDVVKVARGTPLSELLKRPDTDILESPSGKHATVGELRRLAQSLPPGIRR